MPVAFDFPLFGAGITGRKRTRKPEVEVDKDNKLHSLQHIFACLVKKENLTSFKAYTELHLSNRSLENALNNCKIANFESDLICSYEAKYNKKSRFEKDVLLTNSGWLICLDKIRLFIVSFCWIEYKL